MFASTIDLTSVLSQYGLAGLVIATLAGVCVYLYNQLLKERNRNDIIQEQRIVDAKQTSEKMVGPLEELNRINKQNNELLQIIINRREK